MGELLRRRAMMEAAPGGGGHSLPPEYKEVEYLNASGGGYFNLGSVSFTSPGYKIDFMITSRPNQYGPHIISCQSSSGGVLWLVARSFRNSTLVNYCGAESALGTAPLPFNQRMTASLNVDNDNAFEIPTMIAKTILTPGTSKSGTMFLAAYGGGVNQSIYRLNGNIYKCEFYDSGEQTMNLIPCYRREDGVIGLYDTVGDVFYQATGTWATGPDV